MTTVAAEALAGFAGEEGTLPRSAPLMDGDHLVVLDDGAPVGLACVGTAARPEGVAPAEDGASDVWLAVLPTRRAAGVATRACDLLVETLRLGGHTRLRATVPMDDVAAGRLAVRCGCSRRADVVADDGRACAVYELEVLA